MAPFFFSPVLFVTLPVLVWLVDRADGAATAGMLRRLFTQFAPGWWFGFGYFTFGLFWIGEAFLVEADRFLWALPFAVTLLPAGLAIFFGIATAFTANLSRPGLTRVLALALALSSTEWLRGHIFTGFPWNTLGYALTMPVELMQTAAVFGVYGLTLLVVLIFAAPAVLIAADTPVRSAIAVAVLPLLLMALLGAFRLSQLPDETLPGVRLRIVQPSVPQREKWLPENQRRIFFDHIDLSKRLPSGLPDDLAAVTHVIWPEAAMPFRPLQSPEALAAIGEMLPAGKFLLAGGLRTIEPVVGEVEARNSMMVFSKAGDVVGIYDKIHLVPFGEYLPFKTMLERVGLQQLARQRGGFGAGPNPRPLMSVPGLPAIGPLICYEAIFPSVVVQGAQRPGILINITNDGWFGNSTGPRQHLHQARVRAVEEGVPLVRAANNGISAMIAPSGRIIARLELNARGSLDVDVPRATAPPIYARFGDLGYVLLWLLTASLLAGLRIKSPSDA